MLWGFWLVFKPTFLTGDHSGAVQRGETLHLRWAKERRSCRRSGGRGITSEDKSGHTLFYCKKRPEFYRHGADAELFRIEICPYREETLGEERNGARSVLLGFSSPIIVDFIARKQSHGLKIRLGRDRINQNFQIRFHLKFCDKSFEFCSHCVEINQKSRILRNS